MVRLVSANPVSDDFRAAVAGSIHAFLDAQVPILADIHPATAPLLERARLFTRGGKRLRPAFCAWAYAAVAGSLDLPEAVATAAASLDVLHVSALMHDDVMDASDFRRGVPAAHRQFEADHRDADWRGDPEQFGRAGAILLGDLLLVWSEEMFRRSGLEPAQLDRGRPHLEAVRTEVTAGQYLDVLAQARDPYTISRTDAGREQLADLVRTVVTWKSASYTIRRPLLLGAALAGADAAQLGALTSFGQPLGRALVEPHRSYLPHFRAIRQVAAIKGMAHLTGGGFVDNIPRILPPGVCAVVDRSAWAVPPLFRLIEEVGQVDHDEMYRVFNMGIGMVLAVAPGDAPAVLAAEPAAVVIGEVVASATERVRLR